MKIILCTTTVTEAEYLADFKEYSATDKRLFENEKSIVSCDHTFVCHTFNEGKESEFATFIKNTFKEDKRYRQIGDRISIKRLYLPMTNADVVIQLTDAIDQIEDDDDWQVCIDTIKHIPSYVSYQLGLTQNPEVLCVLFSDQ